jgi:hypothetical protein
VLAIKLVCEVDPFARFHLARPEERSRLPETGHIEFGGSALPFHGGDEFAIACVFVIDSGERQARPGGQDPLFGDPAGDALFALWTDL